MGRLNRAFDIQFSLGRIECRSIQAPKVFASRAFNIRTAEKSAASKDESLEDSANLPDADIIAAEIVEDLQAALAQLAEIASDLRNNTSDR